MCLVPSVTTASSAQKRDSQTPEIGNCRTFILRSQRTWRESRVGAFCAAWEGGGTGSFHPADPLPFSASSQLPQDTLRSPTRHHAKGVAWCPHISWACLGVPGLHYGEDIDLEIPEVTPLTLYSSCLKALEWLHLCLWGPSQKSQPEAAPTPSCWTIGSGETQTKRGWRVRTVTETTTLMSRHPRTPLPPWTPQICRASHILRWLPAWIPAAPTPLTRGAPSSPMFLLRLRPWSPKYPAQGGRTHPHNSQPT